MEKYHTVTVDDTPVGMIYAEDGCMAYMYALNQDKFLLEKVWKQLSNQGWMLDSLEQFGPSWYMSCYMETSTTIV